MSRNIWTWLGLDKLGVAKEIPPTAGAVPPPVDRTARELADGGPIPEDNSHTQDRGDGQQKGYIVLTEEERRRGFVRPVRDSYVHVGPPPPTNLRDLTQEEVDRYTDAGFVKFEPNPDYPKSSARTGRFWTKAELDRIGGCGVKTTMGISIAETYARDPKFYSGTYCCGCGAHFPVGERGEFVWDGTQERVGT